MALRIKMFCLKYANLYFVLTPNFRTSGLVDILVQNISLNEEVSSQVFR
jgi:hypothetical protein